MTIKVAVRVSYPETGQYNWYDALASYVDVGAVEVAFYQTEAFLENVDLAAVAAPFSILPLEVTTVHMAHARITGFHLHKPQAELLADVENYVQVIGCFHVSNRSERLRQHLPLRHPEGDIGFEEFLMAIDRVDFQGPIVLEYLPAYHEYLLPDALWARKLLAV